MGKSNLPDKRKRKSRKAISEAGALKSLSTCNFFLKRQDYLRAPISDWSEFTGPIDPMLSCHLRSETKKARKNPLLAGLMGSALLVHGF